MVVLLLVVTVFCASGSLRGHFGCPSSPELGNMGYSLPPEKVNIAGCPAEMTC